MRTQITLTAAAMNDPGQMTEFLAAIPDGDRLGTVLARTPAVCSRAYQDETETARFVASDGHIVRCFAVSGITIDQAEMIAALDTDLLACDQAAFEAAVAVALGPTL